MNLNYTVVDQKLRPSGILPSAVSDSIDYIHFNFSVDEKWAKMVVVAQFTQGAQVLHQVLDDQCHCTLPTELSAGTVGLMLFGQVTGGTIRATTNSVNLNIGDSGFVGDGETPVPPTPDLYSQLLDDAVRGLPGIDGTDGASAYEIAVENGYEGTETEWLLSLKGADGADGQDGATGAQGEKGDTGETGATGAQGEKGDTGDTGTAGADGADGQDGTNGIDGTDGASAYEIAVENGYEGTETEWLLSLKGADGADGQDGATGAQGEKGDTGDTGVALLTSKTYSSTAEMQAGYDTDGLDVGSYVIISPSDIDDEDYGKIYQKGSAEYEYVIKLSYDYSIVNSYVDSAIQSAIYDSWAGAS